MAVVRASPARVAPPGPKRATTSSGKKSGNKAAAAAAPSSALAVGGTPAQRQAVERQGSGGLGLAEASARSWASGQDPFEDLPELDEAEMRLSSNLRESLR